jgi:hypothetical protein
MMHRSTQGGTPALIRMGHFDFLSPAFIGDVCRETLLPYIHIK